MVFYSNNYWGNFWLNVNFIVGVLIIAVLLGGLISTVAYPIIVELKLT